MALCLMYGAGAGAGVGCVLCCVSSASERTGCSWETQKVWEIELHYPRVRRRLGAVCSHSSLFLFFFFLSHADNFSCEVGRHPALLRDGPSMVGIVVTQNKALGSRWVVGSIDERLWKLRR